MDFAEFHHCFQGGDTDLTFKICAMCGGACEFNKCCMLLPCEAEYMAQKMGESVTSFRAKYLDGILLEDGQVVDMLKATYPCVFLDTSQACSVKSYKPILCLIYPLVVEPDTCLDTCLVRLDDVCPLTQSETSVYFENEGRILVEQLRIPSEWLAIDIDEYDFDFLRMLAERGCDIQEYKVYELQEILSFVF